MLLDFLGPASNRHCILSRTNHAFSQSSFLCFHVWSVGASNIHFSVKEFPNCRFHAEPRTTGLLFAPFPFWPTDTSFSAARPRDRLSAPSCYVSRYLKHTPRPVFGCQLSTIPCNPRPNPPRVQEEEFFKAEDLVDSWKPSLSLFYSLLD